MKRSRVSVSGESSPRITACGERAAAAREHAVDQERDHERDERSRRSRAIQSSVARPRRTRAGCQDPARTWAARLEASGRRRAAPCCSTRWARCCASSRPAPRLRAALRERLGVDVGAARPRAAMRAEIALLPRAPASRAATRASLAALRERCAEAMRPALPPAAARRVPARARPRRCSTRSRSRAYPDAAPALRGAARGRLRARRRLQLGRLAARAARGDRAWRRSSTARSRRPSSAPRSPSRAIFERALALAGVGAAARLARGRQRRGRRRGRACGRDPAGARRTRGRAAPGGAPMPGRRLRCRRRKAVPAGVPVLTSLDGLPALVAAGAP